MHVLDWSILLLFLVFTVWDGWRKAGKTHNIEEFFLAGRRIPWWAAGISVMATHASAITFIGTTGQAYVEDMRFLQVYLGIPFAMVILSVTLLPYYRKMRNYSAYEVLEERFGVHTRLTTSFLFLVSRGLALGFVIAAPSYVLSLILGIGLDTTIIAMGAIATLYTVAGGMGGVIRTDIRQMGILVFGLLFCFVWIFVSLPESVGADDALYLAGTLEKLNAIDFSFDLAEKYNVWSGVLAGIFLMLSYFGCDQTQVQRYLTARTLRDAQGSLLLTAFAKVPMQFVILLLGVMVYVFYIFGPAPLTFRTIAPDTLPPTVQAEGEKLQQEFSIVHSARREAALNLLDMPDDVQARQNFLKLDQTIVDLRQSEHDRLKSHVSSYDDTNYIIPYFITHQMPAGFGLIGLIIAGIFAAALSSIDSALNSLSTVSIVDWYKRLQRRQRSDSHYLSASRLATVSWGLLATASALMVARAEGSIIELVNQVGSYFYGSILGVFVLLLWVKRATGFGAFLGLLLGMLSVYLGDSIYVYNAADGVPFSGSYALVLPGLLVDGSGFHFGASLESGWHKAIQYLWLNPLGAGVVVAIGLLFRRPAASA